jgi:uncharacterized hydrophobic protein (TIGR00271 family)
MSFLHSSRSLEKDGKQKAIIELLNKSAHDSDFYVLLLGATVLAIGALFTDSVPVLIASMIVAPLAYPILSLGLGIASTNMQLIMRSAILLLVATSTTLAIAAVVTLIFGDARVPNQLITFDSNRTISFVVAIVSGVIATYGLIRPKVGSAITGIAIAVSLLPPLVATGINYAAGNTHLGQSALTVFVLNVIGMLVSSVIIFLLFGMGREYKEYALRKDYRS